MAKERNFDFLDYLILLVKNKKSLLGLFLLTFLLSYGAIYFFVGEKYDSTAIIVPSDQDQLGGFSSLLKSFSSLPVGLGNISKGTSVDMFKTIIYSRSNLEKVANEFNLLQAYNLKSMEKTLKQLSKNINAEETKEGAFEITVRAEDPKTSAKMANFIVDELNKRIIELNIRKSHENKMFLEDRYTEIRKNLGFAEDSLKIFQERTGFFEAKDQIKATIDAYSKLETDLATKQIEFSVMEKIMGVNSPTVNNAKIALTEQNNKLNSIKSGNEKGSLILPIASLPKDAINYYRYYREVEILNKMLEFIVPLYEQAKFEEQKDVPILQIIDYAAPPEKRAFPQRVLMSLLITAIIIFLYLIFLLLKQNLSQTENPKIVFIKREIFKFSSRGQ